MGAHWWGGFGSFGRRRALKNNLVIIIKNNGGGTLPSPDFQPLQLMEALYFFFLTDHYPAKAERGGSFGNTLEKHFTI